MCVGLRKNLCEAQETVTLSVTSMDFYSAELAYNA